MKNILFLLLISMPFASFGQAVVTPEICTQFVQKNISKLNMLLWNEALAGTSTVYNSDSLKTILSPKDIQRNTSITSTVMIPNPDNPDDPYDLVPETIVFKFEPNNFEGTGLSFKREIKKGTISYQLEAIAPLWAPMTESGIELGKQPMFWITAKSLKKLVGKELYEFYISLFTIRSSFGDFAPYYFSPFDKVENVTNGITGVQVYNDKGFQYFTDFHDSAVGRHLSELLGAAADNAGESVVFYKDANLYEPYLDLKTEAGSKVAVMVPNPDNPDDPYDLIVREVIVGFEFSQVNAVNAVKISQLKKDFLIQFVPNRYTETGIEAADESTSIYTKWSQLKPMISKADQVVFLRLLDSFKD